MRRAHLYSELAGVTKNAKHGEKAHALALDPCTAMAQPLLMA